MIYASMRSYRRAKFAIDSFRGVIAAGRSRSRLDSDSQAKALIQDANRLFKRYMSSSSNLSGKKITTTTSPAFKPSSQINSSQNLVTYKKVDGGEWRPTYSAYEQPKRSWGEKIDNVFGYSFRGYMFMILCGLVVYAIDTRRETVPYTKRVRFVSLIMTPNVEKRLGDFSFHHLKKEGDFRGKNILPENDPRCVRITLILKRILEALQKGIKQDAVWRNDRGCASERKRLEELNWEVIVVNEPKVNAFCAPGGKIIIYTGLLESFTTDDEIATIIGHEVAHAVARHTAESIVRELGFKILELFLTEDRYCRIIHNFFILPAQRRMEIEADYIGLLLMSSAGYNPRIAPKVYKKFDQMSGLSPLWEYTSIHPSGKKRAQLLVQPKNMKKALAMYKEAK